MPRRKPVTRRALHWWSADIAGARKRTKRLWRRMSKARKTGRLLDAENLRRDLTEAKKELRGLIRTAKEGAWFDFLQTLDRDFWGRPYKLVMNRFRPWTRSVTELLDPVRTRDIVAALFPDRPAAIPRGNL